MNTIFERNKRSLIALGAIALTLIYIEKYAIVVTKHPFFWEKTDEFVVTDLGTIELYKVRSAYSEEGIGLYFGWAKPNKIQDFFYVDSLSTHSKVSVHKPIIVIERDCDKDYIRYEPLQSPVLVNFVCRQ